MQVKSRRSQCLAEDRDVWLLNVNETILIAHYFWRYSSPPPGGGVDHPPSSSAEVKETVKIYLCYTFGSSWTVLGRTLTLLLPSNYDMIYLLTATGLSPGGSSTVHIYTQTIHRTTQNKQYIEQHNNAECRPCPVLANYTLAFALQLRKKHGKNLSQGSHV
jgi:hypothetical protein